MYGAGMHGQCNGLECKSWLLQRFGNRALCYQAGLPCQAIDTLEQEFHALLQQAVEDWVKCREDPQHVQN